MERINKKIQLIYGIGVSYAIIDQIFAQWVLYYYLPPENSGLKPILAPLFISLALVLSRFVDMIMDPLVGYWSDSFNSKWGRRIPFIAGGALPLGIFTILFFYPPKSNESASFIYLALIGAAFFVFYTFVGGPYNAIIPEIGHNKKEQLDLSTSQAVFRLLYTAIAIILPGILIKILGKGNTELGLRLMVISLTVFSLIGVYIMIFSLNEKKYSHGRKSTISIMEALKHTLKDRNFVIYLFGFLFFFIGFNNLRASMNYYIEDIMGMGKGAITMASALMFGTSALFFYPANKFSTKYGYKKLMIFSLLSMSLLSLSIFGLGKIIDVKFGMLIFCLMGIPIAGGAFILPPAMLSDISSRSVEKTGHNIEGMYFGIQGFFLKLAFLVSIAILPIILISGEGMGFIEALSTKPESVSKIGVYNTSLFSTLFFMISFVFYMFYKEERA